ncbi:MAG: hypothetical protein EZS28_048861 [Streblomastix strix]|uniref:Uncharacterized protein n=1 Tax=Streblomastix strix TaxID=222440 RepID=A0A5J4TCF1_9EUKA|nr:MAG: hypothetical protein EZS28_048861 [Streblomastix strix]
MFQAKFLKDIDTIHNQSDCGPHFRNIQFIWGLLNIDNPTLPVYAFEINFSEPYHGKGPVDGIFGNYGKSLQKNMPKERISSLLSLVQLFRNITSQQAAYYKDESRKHDIIIFNEEADYLVIDQFKKFLNFLASEDEMVTRPLTKIADVGQRTFPMKYSTRDVKGTPKRSTVPIQDK